MTHDLRFDSMSRSERRDDPVGGFGYAADHRTAVRQFRVSLCVVVVLGVAILASAFNLRTAPLHDGAATMLSLMIITTAQPAGIAGRS